MALAVALDHEVNRTADLPLVHLFGNIPARLHRDAVYFREAISGPQTKLKRIRPGHHVRRPTAAIDGRVDAQPEIELPAAVQKVGIGQAALAVDAAEPVDDEPMRPVVAIGAIGLP